MERENDDENQNRFRLHNDDARLTLDFAIGAMIFFFTLIFLSQFIPAVFADVRSEIALANQAYRVAAVLTEDPGIYANTSLGSSYDWERLPGVVLCDSGVIFRPGLANYSFDEGIKYNELSIRKIERLFEVLELCPEKVRKSLGLNLTEFGGSGVYHFRVALTNISGGDCLPGMTNEGGDQEPIFAQKIKYGRLVHIYTASEEKLCKLEVTVWP
jgi:hypothetical protein